MGTFQRRCRGSIGESIRISMYILITILIMIEKKTIPALIEKKTIPALAPTAENCYNMIPGSKGHAFSCLHEKA